MKQLTDINIVLDRSGSMSSCWDGTIKSLNDFVESQKKDPGECTVSLYQFDAPGSNNFIPANNYTFVGKSFFPVPLPVPTDDWYLATYEGVSLNNVPPLTRDNFVPRGGTALRDAIGRTINNVGARLASLPEKDRPNKVLLVIITDGAENSSVEFTSNKQILDMIKHQEDVYSWTFVFLGAGINAEAAATSYGISSSNALRYSHDQQGWASGTACLAKSSSVYKSSHEVGSCKSFFGEIKKNINVVEDIEVK